MTNPLWDIEYVPWATLRTARGKNGDKVRSLLERLWRDESRVAADELSEHLAISGLWFEVAAPAVRYLMRMLAATDSPVLTLAILGILDDLAYGESHRTEIEVGNDKLDNEMRVAIQGGAASLGALLGSPAPGIRALALNVLASVVGPTPWLLWVITQMESDADVGVVQTIQSVRDHFADR